LTTIHDVAARANVSVSTVSHVLNGTRFVAPATAQRVLDAVQALNYRPNLVARSLRRRKTHTIGLIVPDNSNPFFAEIARVIEDCGYAKGYAVILCNSDGSPEKEAVYIDALVSKQVDGIILIPSGEQSGGFEYLLDQQLPMILVDRELGDLPVDQITIDNEIGAYLAGQYLVQLGHREIGYISGPQQIAPSHNRLVGLRRALAEVGVNLGNDAIAAGDFQYSGGVLAMQVSVIGFDGIVAASMMWPPITTIAQPIAAIGEMSVATLLERLDDSDSPPKRIVLTPSLIIRESCRAVSM